MNPLHLYSALFTCSLSLSTANAAFLLIDDFESGNSFGGSTATDPTNPNNTVLEGPISEGSRNRILTAGERLNDNESGTLFFQAIITSHNVGGASDPDGHDISVGLTANGNNGFGDYIAQVGFVTTSGTNTDLRVRNGNGTGGGGFTTVGSLSLNTLYNIWIVTDLTENNYDVYVEGAGFTGQQQVANNFGFRQTLDPGPLTNILLKEGGADALNSPLLVDNFYSEQGMENLTNPVPEPSSVLLVGAGCLGLALRRCRF